MINWSEAVPFISEVYGFTPAQIGDLTLSQFYAYRDYAYRARVESLMGHYNFADKNNKWKAPGFGGTKRGPQISAVEAQLLAIKKRTGKSVLGPNDLKGII